VGANGLVGVLLAAVVATGCAGSASDDLEELRRSKPKDTYFLGESFEGYELEHAEPGFFVYGTCDPAPDSGCGPPVQIQHIPYRSHDWEIAQGCRRAGTIRGVPAIHHDTYIALTRGWFVKIYATSGAQTKRAFGALRSLDGRIARGDPLPRARAGVIRAVLRACAPR
jgi:hypothetical protein